MVDNKAVVILMTLMSYRELTRYELSVKTKFSIKEIEERIGDLNHFLKEHHFPLIGISQSHYQISQELKEASEQIFEPLNAEQIYLSQAERINLIYLYTFCRKEFVSNTHYQDFLKVSKNTTLTDIKALRAKMANFGLALNYSCSTGYILVGPERQKHQLAMATISQPLTSSIGLWALDYVLASWNYPVSFERVSQSVKDYYQTFQMSPILDRLQEGLYAILFMACRYQRVKESVKVEPLLVSEQLQQLTTLLLSTILTDFEQPESYQKEDHHYFSLLLAGCFEGEGDVSDQFFDNLTVAIINQIQTVALLNFQQIDQLKTDLKRHLVPAYYRLRYGLPSHNDYTLRIKESYADLFDLVQQALQPLAQELNCPIPDSEISYFVLHFGGYLKTVKEASDKPYKAVIICPNGVSSSLIIKENLKVLFPEIAFQGISRIDQLDQMDKSCYDLIFSTLPLETTKPSYLVPMVMTDEQSLQLVKLVSQDFPEIGRDIETDRLLDVISPFVTVNQEDELRIALKTYLRQDFKRKDYRPVLNELITPKTYQFTTDSLDWKEAIRLAAKPLLDGGQIEASYPEAMIQKVEDFGPFINLGKGIAIPHARPEDGVKEVGMSMLVLDNPIFLLDDTKQEIHLLICIAAIDNETHLKALSQLTTILRDNGKVAQLLRSTSYQDITTIISEEV